MGKSKILLVFPDGVGIRNYLYTDVFKSSAEELVLLHGFDDETVTELKNLTAVSSSVKMPIYKETLPEKFLRELICLSRLKYNAGVTGNKTILTNWKSSHKAFSKNIFYKSIAFCAPFSKKYASILKLEKKYQKAIRKNIFYHQIKAILQEVQPDKLFCSHQRGLQCATIFAAAKDLGIETNTVIYSWDNLPKARMALRADKYLVWSAYMKSEMELYYPEIPSESIHITGTPQFECYGKPENIIPKEEFYARYNLESNRKIICFSGDDSLTSPDDPKYLEDIASEICKAGLEKEYQLLLRRSPVDLSGRFESILSQFPDLIKEAPPLWFFKDATEWTAIYPTTDDVRLLVSTAYYCDTVINVGSTMAFDFSMFNKSCIFINYDQNTRKDDGWSVEWIYQLQHFKSMPNKEAVLWLNNKEEIITKIKSSVSVESSEAMNKWAAIVIGDYTNTSLKIKEVLNIN